MAVAPARSVAPSPATRSSDPSTWPLGVHLDGAGGGTALVWAPRAERVELLRWPASGADDASTATTPASVPATTSASVPATTPGSVPATTSANTSAAPPPGGSRADRQGRHAPEHEPEVLALAPGADGYHAAEVAQLAAGDRYRFRLHHTDGSVVDRADPASRWQPEGVHGPSAVDDPAAFAWTDASFRVSPMADQVLYELHVGTFSPEGTFDGVAARLDHLVELGITTIELMPVWQFPGARNWGYDGVLPFAVQDTYGGPEGLRRLVDAAHARGIAVILDVVHNHFGPEGNHLGDFGPYLSEHRMTPWGPGLNADGPGADAVRRFVTEHLASFVRDLHLDGFRLDAVHGIVDQSATHLLEQLATAVHAEAARHGRTAHLIAESDLCDARLIRGVEVGGYGLDAQWADDLHHAVHVALTGERDGYYVDHTGLGDLASMLRDRYVYAGRRSRFRGRTIGRPAPDVPYDRFVVCVQNHDQTGNRMLGERLTSLTDAAGLRVAAGVLLSLPYVPMLFMGEEYAEPNPFQYFVSHTDEALIEVVRTGRREEFAYFAHQGQAPDPQAERTFVDSTIDLTRVEAADGDHAALFALYRALIRVRAALPLLRRPDAPDPHVTVLPGHDALVLHRMAPGADATGDGVLVAINAEPRDLEVALAAPGPWVSALHTDETVFGGPGISATDIDHDITADHGATADQGATRDTSPEATVRLPLPARSVHILIRPDHLPAVDAARAAVEAPR